MRTVFKSKIHRATVTEADLDYEGSITIDSELMKLANIQEYEQIHVWNLTNGSRLITYAIEGEKNSGKICMNGAGAHLTKPGDMVIIATFYQSPDAFDPIVVLVDEDNRPVKK